MPGFRDGPASSLFRPIRISSHITLDQLAASGIPAEMAEAVKHAPAGQGVAWGIPFEVDQVVVIRGQPVHIAFEPIAARQLVFMHSASIRHVQPGPGGFLSPTRWPGQLAEHAADYVLLYADGSEERVAIRRRHQIGAHDRMWGENCFEAVAAHKPHPTLAAHEQLKPDWGETQTRVVQPDWANG